MAGDNSLIGKQVGNYRILAEINSGSFGSVYQGKHIIFEDDPAVAIKLLHTALRSPQEHTDFIKEAQVLKKLNHPHILRILDAGFQDDVPYLVTEYAAGGSLRDRLNKSDSKPFPLDEVINILTQIGQALHYAHERHIIHRDLKPENILFNQTGEALLADFGIAVLLASTRTGLVGVSGTPPYMAPEQFEGLASAKSDQYSLGCIAYELVTGHRLFTIPNPTLEAYWFHHAKVEPIPPTRFHPHLPSYIEQAILTTLSKDRTYRHSDVLVFGNALFKSSQKWREEGDTHFKEKRYEEALTAYEHSIHHDPNDVYAYYIKGLTLRNLNRYNEALSAYEHAIRLNPDFADAYNGKGTTLRNLKRHEEALTAFEQAIRLGPDNFYAYYNKGNTLYILKHYEEALSAYEHAIRLNPDFADAYNGKGIALANLKSYEEALIAYEHAIRLDPNNVYAYNGKGKAFRDLKRHEEALTAVDQAIRFDPNNVYSYSVRGAILGNLKRYKEALSAFEYAICLNPDFADAYNSKGATLNVLGRYKEALTAFDQAICLNPNLANAYNNKGIALRYLECCEEALTAFDQSIRLDPNFALAYFGKGMVLNDLKRHEEALTAFDQSIRFNPNYALAYHNKGTALNNIGKTKEAERAFSKACQLGYNG